MFTTKALRAQFVVKEPGASYDAEPFLWKNRLKLRNRLVEGSPRRLELLVAPRGDIRYTLDGSEPRNGTPYGSPVELPDGEVTVLAFAEADGLEAKASFTFAAKGQTAPKIDAAKPAEIASTRGAGKKLDAREKVYGGLSEAKERGVRFRGVSLTIGNGDTADQFLFGDRELTPEHLKRVCSTPRSPTTLTAPDAPLTLAFRHARLRQRPRPRSLRQGPWASNSPPARVVQVSDSAHTGFGVPERPGVHHFRVEIPRKNSEPVLVVECFGDAGGHGGVPAEEPRVRLEAGHLGEGRDAAKKAFNPRLKEAKAASGKWTTGEVRVDRNPRAASCACCSGPPSTWTGSTPPCCAPAGWRCGPRSAGGCSPSRWPRPACPPTASAAGVGRWGWRSATRAPPPPAASRSHARARPPEDRPLLFPGATTLAS